MALKLILIICLINYTFSIYDEKYRPQLHYSPPMGWMNDPNGLVFYENIYHLYYQYNPNDLKPGPMSWGHAISKDLFHWRTLPIALSPALNGTEYIFSGSAIIDSENVSGLQANSNNRNKTLIAIFTAHKMPDNLERQWLAYSGDEGLTFRFYDNNPIIPNSKIPDFRDPKVFKYDSHFVAVISGGTHVNLYKSYNLKDWSKLSEFGLKEGSHDGVWECPDLFALNVTINGTSVEKWVMIVNLAVISKVQYFIGSFDGEIFTNDNPAHTVLWLDYGPDNYAGITYNSAPNDRRIFIAWMNNWNYAESVPTSSWRGGMSTPRDLSLIVGCNRTVRLASLPVPEIRQLRGKSCELTNRLLKPNTTLLINSFHKIDSKLLDIELTVDLSGIHSTGSFGLLFAGNKDVLKVYFESKENQFIIDRTKAGRHDFSDKFWLTSVAPRLTDNRELELRLVLDVASIELFADKGLTVMSSVFYSIDNLNSKISLFYETNDRNSGLKVKSISINELKSVWK